MALLRGASLATFMAVAAPPAYAITPNVRHTVEHFIHCFKLMLHDPEQHRLQCSPGRAPGGTFTLEGDPNLVIPDKEPAFPRDEDTDPPPDGPAEPDDEPEFPADEDPESPPDGPEDPEEGPYYDDSPDDEEEEEEEEEEGQS